jgi:hypothetical protein
LRLAQLAPDGDADLLLLMRIRPCYMQRPIGLKRASVSSERLVAARAQLAPDADADLLLLDAETLELRYVIARGEVLRRACARAQDPFTGRAPGSVGVGCTRRCAHAAVHAMRRWPGKGMGRASGNTVRCCADC